MRITSIIIVIALLAGTAQSSKVSKYDGAQKTIEERWLWAVESAGKNTAWIGYSINQQMGEHSRIGSWSQDQPTIAEILDETPPAQETGYKDIALLFLINNPTSQPQAIEDVKIGTFDSELNLKNIPLYWLGSASVDNSFAWLNLLYKNQSNGSKKDVLTAIGLHSNAKSTDFFISVVKSENSESLQKDALFWLGQKKSQKAFDVVAKILESHPSSELRESAVFALSQFESDAAVDLIIKAARQNNQRDVRKEAIFWLGQLAAEKSATTLNDIVYDEPTLELKKHAVFSLSQMKDEQAVNNLINIAKTHPNAEVRKSAIFWLGETGSDKALDVLVGILKE